LPMTKNTASVDDCKNVLVNVAFLIIFKSLLYILQSGKCLLFPVIFES
jgi:hypothetical protein